MKKGVLGSFMVLVLLGLCVPAGAEEKAIWFATDDSPPYTIAASKEIGAEGFMVDVARYVFAKAGYEVHVKFVSYPRSIQEVRDGMVDGVLLVSAPSAPGLVFLQRPISTEKVVFVVKKGSSWRYTGVQSLENVRIGSGAGFDFGDADINEFIRKKVAEGSPLVDLLSGPDVNLRNFQKLLLGRIDVVIAADNIARFVAARNNIADQMEIAGNSTTSLVVQTGFDPKNPKSALYADILSRGVLEITNSGKFHEIRARYGLRD
jgi:polar amino acid transport system substrate-binding protein